MRHRLYSNHSETTGLTLVLTCIRKGMQCKTCAKSTCGEPKQGATKRRRRRRKVNISRARVTERQLFQFILVHTNVTTHSFLSNLFIHPHFRCLNQNNVEPSNARTETWTGVVLWCSGDPPVPTAKSVSQLWVHGLVMEGSWNGLEDPAASVAARGSS